MKNRGNSGNSGYNTESEAVSLLPLGFRAGNTGNRSCGNALLPPALLPLLPLGFRAGNRISPYETTLLPLLPLLPPFLVDRCCYLREWAKFVGSGHADAGEPLNRCGPTVRAASE